MDKYRVASVNRALSLLRAFLEPRHSFGVSELSRSMGLTKNQVYRLLQTLMEEGFVAQDPETKLYSLGFGLVELGAAAAKGTSLVQETDPVLDRLQAETGETISLIVRVDESSAICIAQRASRWRLQVTGSVGSRLPLHAGATPKLLLAYSPQADIERYLEAHRPLHRYTPFTLTDPASLLVELAQIREQGYSESDEDYDLGAWAVAAPIVDNRGNVDAGVSIAVPAARANAEDRVRTREAVMASSKEIALRLGYADPFTHQPVART